MGRAAGFMGFTVIVLTLLGAALTLATPPGTTAEDTLTQGLEVYQTLYCGTCHTLRAAGTEGAFGPPHDALGVIAGARIQDPNYHGEAASAEAYIRESIVSPTAYLVPGYGLSYHHMPAYTSLNEEDLGALVKVLLEQTGAQR